MGLFDDIPMARGAREQRPGAFDPAAGQMPVELGRFDEESPPEPSDPVRLAQARGLTLPLPGGIGLSPDAWNAWRKGALDGIMGARRFYRQSIGSIGGGGGDDKEGCKEERDEALKQCVEAHANGWPMPQGRFVRGPLRSPRPGGRWDVNDCMPGLISERCGGNKVDYGPQGKPRRK